jgi:hypothetical protein
MPPAIRRTPSATPGAFIAHHAWFRKPTPQRLGGGAAALAPPGHRPRRLSEAPLARTVRSNDILQVADAAGEPVAVNASGRSMNSSSLFWPSSYPPDLRRRHGMTAVRMSSGSRPPHGSSRVSLAGVVLFCGALCPLQMVDYPGLSRAWGPLRARSGSRRASGRRRGGGHPGALLKA